MTLTVFVVHLAPGTDAEGMLSEEVLQETLAQVMTTDEASALGFEGFKHDPALRLVAVAPKDKRWIEKALERAPQVVGYDVHQIDA